MSASPRLITERFWPKVDKEGPVHPVLGTRCWLWTGSKVKRGYGKIGAGGRGAGTLDAHRVSWALANGEVPANTCVLHRCDRPACVRPDHLFLGTQLDNMRDARAKGRLRSMGFARGNSFWRNRRELHGDENPRSRVAETDVLRIREAKACGLPLTGFSTELGVSFGTVYKIARGEKRQKG